MAPAEPDFGTHTLPLGVFSTADDRRRRVGVAIGHDVLDLTAASATLWSSHQRLFTAGTLDPVLAAGRVVWSQLRTHLQALARAQEQAQARTPRQARAATARAPRHRIADVELHLPFTVADYVDFYSSEQHTTNVGQIFRPGGDPLPAAWRTLPMGYHGRAGTVVVSGADVPRPSGLRRGEGGAPDVEFGPTRALDVEVEVGWVVGAPSPRGRPVELEALREHVFGLVLLNDWSARDIQSLEYRPLGPFLGKSFTTSISPWVVPLDALDDAHLTPPPRDPPPAAYLDDSTTEPWGLDLTLELRINDQPVSRPEFAGMYWTPAQQLAHLTVNGASLRTGDLFASGTVSGPDAGQWGSLLELSWNGQRPIQLADGSHRTFLQDGDVVTISATARGPAGARLHLGEVHGRVGPRC